MDSALLFYRPKGRKENHMKTPKEWSKNLKKRLVTEDMLEAALFSVNKRAKNWRDKKREYKRYRHADHDYAGEAETQEDRMYKKKDLLLSAVNLSI